MARMFIAVDVPDHAGLVDVVATLAEVGVRPVPVDRLHMTLVFMDDVATEQVEDVKRITQATAAAWEPFPLTLTGRIDRFGAKVAWAELAPSTTLNALATTLRRRLTDGGVMLEERPFHAHITLARASRRRIGAKLVERLTVPRMSWSVSSIALIESELGSGPARWRTVADYPLEG